MYMQLAVVADENISAIRN